MLKTGDQVVWLGPDSSHFTHGQVYKIYSHSAGEFVLITTNTGFNATMRYDPIYWQIVPRPKKVQLPAPKNDIEWLDRVQQNFKE